MADTEVDIEALDAAAAKKAQTGAKGASANSGGVAAEADNAPQAAASDAEAVTPEQGLEKLRKQLKDERDARSAAEARAREAAQAEADARGRAQSSELDLVKNAIASVTQANDALEGRYADALNAQDWAGAAKVQRQMADNSAKLAQLEAGKAALERAPKPVPRAHVDPVEAFCAQLTPASAAWVRAHPEFVRDEHKNRQMIAAHELALARGHTADTDEYFRSIERTLDLGPAARLPSHADDPERQGAVPATDGSEGAAAAASGGREIAPPGAPVSRTGNGANGSRPNVVRLTPDEVEMAQNMGMSVEEYARNKVALKKEGKIS